jgi:integration host factor subunit beta
VGGGEPTPETGEFVVTKSELVAALALKCPELTRKHTEVVVNTVFDSMRDALARGERIEIRGFGSFQVRERSARKGRNPKTGASVAIGDKRVPFFKVGKDLRELVNGGGD